MARNVYQQIERLMRVDNKSVRNFAKLAKRILTNIEKEEMTTIVSKKKSIKKPEYRGT